MAPLVFHPFEALIADDHIVLPVGTIAHGICGTVQADDRCPEGDGEMERARVACNHEFRASK